MVAAHSPSNAVIKVDVPPPVGNLIGGMVDVAVNVNLVQDLQIPKRDVVAAVVMDALVIHESAFIPRQNTREVNAQTNTSRIREPNCCVCAGAVRASPGRQAK